MQVPGNRGLQCVSIYLRSDGRKEIENDDAEKVFPVPSGGRRTVRLRQGVNAPDSPRSESADGGFYRHRRVESDGGICFALFPQGAACRRLWPHPDEKLDGQSRQYTRRS